MQKNVWKLNAIFPDRTTFKHVQVTQFAGAILDRFGATSAHKNGPKLAKMTEFGLKMKANSLKLLEEPQNGQKDVQKYTKACGNG